MLGGLIGLGGAEFRLPLLVRVFGYDLERAVFLNLAVSLVTVVSALASRLAFGVGPSVLASGLDLVVALAADSAFGAYRGAVSGGVSEAGLHRAVRALGAGCTAGASVKAPKIPLAAYLGDTAQPAAPSTCLDASSEGRLGQFITVYRNEALWQAGPSPTLEDIVGAVKWLRELPQPFRHLAHLGAAHRLAPAASLKSASTSRVLKPRATFPRQAAQVRPPMPTRSCLDDDQLTMTGSHAASTAWPGLSRCAATDGVSRSDGKLPENVGAC